MFAQNALLDQDISGCLACGSVFGKIFSEATHSRHVFGSMASID
jgi:hypothetical protein